MSEPEPVTAVGPPGDEPRRALRKRAAAAPPASKPAAKRASKRSSVPLAAAPTAVEDAATPAVDGQPTAAITAGAVASGGGSSAAAYSADAPDAPPSPSPPKQQQQQQGVLDPAAAEKMGRDLAQAHATFLEQCQRSQQAAAPPQEQQQQQQQVEAPQQGAQQQQQQHGGHCLVLETDVAAAVGCSALVGRQLRVLWPLYQAWYLGTVTAYDAAAGEHTVRCREREWV